MLYVVKYSGLFRFIKQRVIIGGLKVMGKKY